MPVCKSCSREAVPGKLRCENCIASAKKYKDKEYKRRKEEGLCGNCGKLPREVGTMCQNCSTYRKEYARKRYTAARDKIMQAYGNACACCGEMEPMFLSLDHVQNNGANHRREVGTGTKFFEWVVNNNYPDTLQILCANCNTGKHRNGGVCPHQEAE